MSGRAAKKMRKAMRAQLRTQGIDAAKFDALLQERVDESFEEVCLKVGQWIKGEYEKRLRPRPRWVPGWAWQRIVDRVIGPEPELPKSPEDAGFKRVGPGEQVPRPKPYTLPVPES